MSRVVPDTPPPHPAVDRMWTTRIRRWALSNLPPDKLMPDSQPSYVASWIYVFGVLTLSALAVIVLTGTVLVVKGPSWWHTSSVGLFVNSLHLWSVELFFFFMVIHLWGKFFMSAWRGRRALTWMTGVVCFLVSVGTAFTGYLSQQNFDTQWIATQAKDGLNSTGIGAFFNVMNFGQMLAWHIVLLPAAVCILVALHVLLVRVRGVVPPLPARSVAPTALAATAAAGDGRGSERGPGPEPSGGLDPRRGSGGADAGAADPGSGASEAER